jgi:hippurate hydrolase
MTDLRERAERVLSPLEAVLPGLRDCYVDLHRHPELSSQEVRTAGVVADALAASGFEVTAGVGGTGVVGVLRNGEGPTVALRADMDALPVREETGLPYASDAMGRGPAGEELPVAHACGHDAHTTCLLGTADLLARDREQWRGTVLCIAQPAEETMTGARAMLDDGLYERFGTPSIVLGQHVAPFPAGCVRHRAGRMLAATLSLDITIFGKGGHGSRPEATIDPVVVGAFVVTRLQTIVSREITPHEPVVVTVGEFHGGTKSNIIPDSARLSVNIRTYSDEIQARVVAAIERIVRAEADAAGCETPPRIAVAYGGPATTNDDRAVEQVTEAHRSWFGGDRVLDMPGPAMGSEDFGLFGQAPERTVPTAYWFWGGAGPAQIAAAPGDDVETKLRSLAGNHHPAFCIDPEPALRTGVEALTVAALAFLG